MTGKVERLLADLEGSISDRPGACGVLAELRSELDKSVDDLAELPAGLVDMKMELVDLKPEWSSQDLDTLLRLVREPPEIDAAAVDRMLAEMSSSVLAKHGGKAYRVKWDEDGAVRFELDGYVTLEVRRTRGGLALEFKEVGL